MKMLERLLRAQREVLTTRRGGGERCRALLRHLLPAVDADVAILARCKPGEATRFLHEPNPLDGTVRNSLRSSVQSVLKSGHPLGNGQARSLVAMLHGPARQRCAESLHRVGIRDAVVSMTPLPGGMSVVCAARNGQAQGGFSRFERILLHLLHASCAGAISEPSGGADIEDLSPGRRRSRRCC